MYPDKASSNSSDLKPSVTPLEGEAGLSRDPAAESSISSDEVEMVTRNDSYPEDELSIDHEGGEPSHAQTVWNQVLHFCVVNITKHSSIQLRRMVGRRCLFVL